MYVVRRHTRPLFFPAGLLALGWLLCLGCALLAARPELRRLRQRVMQISLPQLKRVSQEQNATILRLPEWDYSSNQLDTLTTWHTVQFTGNPWQDYFTVRTTAFVAQQLVQDPNHSRGLRVRFGVAAHYHSFVQVMDAFTQAGLQRYWMNIQDEPLTIYSFTKRRPSSYLPPEDGLLCGDVESYMAPLPPPPSWQQQLRTELTAAFKPATWAPLFSPDWRYSTLLLLLLPLAAAWQLRRLRSANSAR